MRDRSLRYHVLILIAIGLFSLFVSPQPACADTITVCTTGCDFTTVQAAIEDEGTQSGDTISLLDAVHTEPGIVVDKDVMIQGQGPMDTIVQAAEAMEAGDDRVFYITAGATATIRDMTIRFGNPISEPESGGGIRNEGTLTVEDCLITQNSASAGGGILNDGSLTVINSTISDNVARGGHNRYVECSTGGGMKNMTGRATLINTTISGNTAEGKGGGIHVACPAMQVLINSTISGNTTMNDGGGIFLNGEGRFTHATITDNTAVNGGGIYIEGSGERDVIRGQLSYTHTIIAGNTATRPNYSVADCFTGDHATIATNADNFVGDGSCNAVFSGDPLLEPLADSVADFSDVSHIPQTHALQPGSPAINAVTADECGVETDQRGAPRPHGSGCDLGAFEAQTTEEQETPSAPCIGSVATALAGSLIPAVFLLRQRSEKSENAAH
jgi:hypothetical protein